MDSLRRLTRCGLAALLCLAATPAVAETPATALDVSVYYLDVDAVVAATEVGLVPEVGEALADPERSHGERLAILDALGWSVSGSSNAPRFLDILASARDTHARELRLEDLSAAEALALGVLLARDEPNEAAPVLSVDGALDGVGAAQLLERAQAAAPTSYTVALAHALVSASAVDRRCGGVATIGQVVRGHEGERDLRPEADAMVVDLFEAWSARCPGE